MQRWCVDADRNRDEPQAHRLGSLQPVAAPERLGLDRAGPAQTRREMAPQRLEKIESAPGNGMVSEASKPQHLVHGRAADRARPPGVARTLSNSTRGAGRKFSASQSIEIARNRERISEASPARRTDRRSSRAASPAPARRSRWPTRRRDWS